MDKSTPLSQLFGELLQRSHLKDRYVEARLRLLWPKLMGEGIATHTLELYLRQNTLHIGLGSSVLRWELATQKKNLLARLNDALGEDILQDIVLK